MAIKTSELPLVTSTPETDSFVLVHDGDTCIAHLGNSAIKNVGEVNGVAGLDGTGVVPSGQLPTTIPSADEKAALVGSSGTPSATNKYVTEEDDNTFMLSPLTEIPTGNVTYTIAEGAKNYQCVIPKEYIKASSGGPFTLTITTGVGGKETVIVPILASSATALVNGLEFGVYVDADGNVYSENTGERPVAIKASIVDADEITINDSASLFRKARVLFSVLKSTLKVYFDILYGDYTTSGVYTPTFQVGVNVTSVSSPYACTYTRAGGVVTVTGAIEVDTAAANTGSIFTMSLPLTTDITNTYQLTGMACVGSQVNSWSILGSTASNNAQFYTNLQSITTEVPFLFNFTYLL